MSPRPDLSDYVDVAERLAAFRDKHPQGSLQAEVIPSPEGFVAVKAYAYRSATDDRPGTGLAWEPFPGRTPYTKDSELQNAETSAWGRAIVAVLAADTKRGIASREEVSNRDETWKPVPLQDGGAAAIRTSTPSLSGVDRGSAQSAGGAPAPTRSTGPETTLVQKQVASSGAGGTGPIAATPTAGAALPASEATSGEQNAPEREQVGGATERTSQGEGERGSKPPACSHPSFKPSPTMPTKWKICNECGKAMKGVAA